MNANVLEYPVYWNVIEPPEGTFDFRDVDVILRSARARPGAHLASRARKFSNRLAAQSFRFLEPNGGDEVHGNRFSDIQTRNMNFHGFKRKGWVYTVAIAGKNGMEIHRPYSLESFFGRCAEAGLVPA